MDNRRYDGVFTLVGSAVLLYEKWAVQKEQPFFRRYIWNSFYYHYLF